MRARVRPALPRVLGETPLFASVVFMPRYPPIATVQPYATHFPTMYMSPRTLVLHRYRVAVGCRVAVFRHFYHFDQKLPRFPATVVCRFEIPSRLRAAPSRFRSAMLKCEADSVAVMA